MDRQITFDYQASSYEVRTGLQEICILDNCKTDTVWVGRRHSELAYHFTEVFYGHECISTKLRKHPTQTAQSNDQENTTDHTVFGYTA